MQSEITPYMIYFFSLHKFKALNEQKRDNLKSRKNGGGVVLKIYFMFSLGLGWNRNQDHK